MDFRMTISVAVGGFAGALARYGIGLLPAKADGAILYTMGINLAGAFLLSFFLKLTLERFTLAPWLRTGISTGFLGAFTTFSGLCADSVRLGTAAPLAMAMYLLVSVAGGMAAAVGGLALARRLLERRPMDA